MSRLTIVLCTLIFISVINASEWFSAMRSVQLRAQRVINETICEAQRKYEYTRKMEEEISKNFSVTATKFGTKISNNITMVSLKVNSQIKRLAIEAENVNITDYIKYSKDLTLLVNATRTKVNECIAKKLNTTLEFIDHVYQCFDNESKRLQEISKHAETCYENLHDVKSAFAALSCTRAYKMKADRVSINFTTTMTTKITMLKSLSTPFKNSLNECHHGVDELYEKASIVVGKAQEYIKKKIHDSESPSKTKRQGS